MKTVFKLTSLVVAMVIVFASCKKNQTTPEETDDTAAFALHSSDQQNSDNVAEMSLSDAEYALAPSSLSGYKTSAYPNLCGASVDTSLISSQKLVVVTFTGTSCDGLRNRSGNIALQLIAGNKWRDVGSVLKITYTNFKVTVISTGKSTTLNGVQKITNVSGGIVARIGIAPNPSTIVRKIRANNMAMTYDDGTIRAWSAARKRTWTGTAGVIANLTMEGDTTLSGNANTEAWGINRAGNAYTTVVNTPLVVTSTCGWYKPVSGKKTHTVNSRTMNITLGTDASGNPINTGCPNHYIINWTSPLGTAKSYIGSY